MKLRPSFRCVFLLSMIFCLMTPMQAQAKDQGLVEDSVRDVLTVVSIGAAGAVLGLSTLSFVDRPQDHLRNIVVGGALGIIIGVGVVAYNQANMSREYYERHALSRDFETSQRLSWHQNSVEQLPSSTFNNDGVGLNYQFSF